LSVSVVLFFVVVPLVPLPVIPTVFEIVTVVEVNDTTVLPDGIAEPVVVSVMPIPVVMFAGTETKVKVVWPAAVVALVMAVAAVVPTTAFESVTVVEVVDTTFVQDPIAEVLVVSLTAMPVATADGTDAKCKVVLPGGVAALVVAVAAEITALESVTVFPLVDTTWVPVWIAEEVVLSATELPGITAAGTVAAMVRTVPVAAVAWLVVLDQRFAALPAPPSLRTMITFCTPDSLLAASVACAAVIAPAR
jgi:hypothetical protein